MLAVYPILSIGTTRFGQVIRLRDTVNVASASENCSLWSLQQTDRRMASKKIQRDDREESHLPFDVTQEIDPSLAEQLRRTSESTLTQVDFEDITLVLPQKPKPRS
jgi:hypothetical protein